MNSIIIPVTEQAANAAGPYLETSQCLLCAALKEKFGPDSKPDVGPWSGEVIINGHKTLFKLSHDDSQLIRNSYTREGYGPVSRAFIPFTVTINLQ